MLKYLVSDSPDFDYLVNEVSNLTDVLRAFGSYRRSQFFQSIAAGTDPYGKPVSPLSAMYAEQKRRKFGQKAIRVASRKTIGSYRQRVIGKVLIEEIPSQVAVFLQEGTSKMPARLLLPDDRGMPAKDQEKLIALVVAKIDRGWKRKRR